MRKRMNKFKKMTHKEAIDYCYEKELEYKKGFDDSDGQEEFNCLVSLLANETIKPEELPNYGME